MTINVPTYKWSIAQWHKLVDTGLLDDKPVELIEGEIVEKYASTLVTYKWSIEQWNELVNTGVLADKPVELLKGCIIEMSPEGVEHLYTNDSVAEYLRDLLRGQAKVFEAHPITLNNSEPEPDITLAKLPATIYRTRKPIVTDIYWLIEIANSTLEKDLGQKAAIYAKAGIPEYWVIDLKNKKVVVHTQPKDNNYSQIVEYLKGVISTQAFPNTKIELSQLLLF